MACHTDCTAHNAAQAAYDAAQAAYEAACTRYDNALDLVNKLAEERGKLDDLNAHFTATQGAIEAAGTTIWSDANQETFNNGLKCLADYGTALGEAEAAAQTELESAEAQKIQTEAARDAAKATLDATPCYTVCDGNEY